MQKPSIVPEDLERWRRRALECRAIAELTSDDGLRHERLETALAYERMAARAERLFGFPDHRSS
jgi:hypothetical protein